MNALAEADLRSITARVMADLGIAGAQAAVMSGNSIVTASLGTANCDLEIPVADDTVFQIGSTTKLFTAVLMFQLVDEGLLDLDKPITTYLPDVRLAAGEEWQAITARHLMSMSSGLDNGPYADTGRGDDCIAKYVDLLAEIPMTFAPGTAYGYSNASTNVSGLIIERLTGSSWDDVLLERFLLPGGFTESVSLFDHLPYHRVAVGKYPGEDKAFRPWHIGRGMGPCGITLATSARDLVRFARMLMRWGAADDGTRILSENAVAMMHTPQVDVPPRGFVDDWCLGPYRRDWGGLDVYGHPGLISNGASHLVWIPERQIAFAITCNTPPANPRFTAVMIDGVLRDAFGLPVPPAPDPAAYGPVDPAPYLGRYESRESAFEVSADSGDLIITHEKQSGYDLVLAPSRVRSTLLPVGPHRFICPDDAVTYGLGWEIAFTLGPDGRAMLFHNGAFTSRRVA